MSTTQEHGDQAAEPAGMTLQTDEAKATVAEIEADNEALEEAYQEAEADAEATAEQAHQLAQATEDVLEELQDGQATHSG
ncbi:MAG TPA: hypothetical protein VK599_04355 [Streptosporangiaceae bacterium]|jgi:hypothetical protein|nr:hypothetical protein [Streptosporangiaceae bacterium]